jgi:hypothetical protein
MHSHLVTPFWKNALQSLPAELQHRYVLQLEAAERWELRLTALVQFASRVKAAWGRMFQTPRAAH